MMTKIIFFCIAQAVFVQHIYCQCVGAYNGYADFATPYGAASYGVAPLAAAPCATEWGVGYSPAALAASHGPGLAVTSASPVPPTGVTAVSETALCGELTVAGQVPFLSSVALEGVLPTVGTGAITYDCGSGAVAITNEEVAPAVYGGVAGPLEYAAGPYGYGPVAAGPVAAGPAFGYGAGYGGCGPIY